MAPDRFKNIYLSITFIFMVESLTLIFMAQKGYRFGIDIGHTLMVAGMVLGMIIAALLLLVMKNFENPRTRFFGITFSVIMILLCIYYPTQLIY